MKHQKFLNELLKEVQTNSEIDIKTLQFFLSLYRKYLSDSEKDAWNMLINLIISYNKKE